MILKKNCIILEDAIMSHKIKSPLWLFNWSKSAILEKSKLVQRLFQVNSIRCKHTALYSLLNPWTSPCRAEVKALLLLVPFWSTSLPLFRLQCSKEYIIFAVFVFGKVSLYFIIGKRFLCLNLEVSTGDSAKSLNLHLCRKQLQPPSVIVIIIMCT